MKFILINCAFVVAIEDEKLQETIDLIKYNCKEARLIIEDKIENTMRHGEIRLRLEI